MEEIKNNKTEKDTSSKESISEIAENKKTPIERIVELEEEISGIETSNLDEEIFKDIFREAFTNIQDLLNNPSEDGLDNNLIAYRGLEELEKYLPKSFGIDFSELKRGLANEISNKEGFRIDEMEDLDSRCDKLKSILEKNLEMNSEALTELEKQKQQATYLEYQKLNKELKITQAQLLKDFGNFYKNSSKKIRDSFIRIGEKIDEKALNSRLFKFLGEHNAFSNMAKVGAVSFIALGCFSHGVEASEIETGDLNEDQSPDSNQVETENSVLKELSVKLQNEIISPDFVDKKLDQLFLNSSADDFGALIADKNISIENKKALVSIFLDYGVMGYGLLIEMEEGFEKMNDEEIITISKEIKKFENNDFLVYLFEDSFLENLKEKKPELVERYLVEIFSEMSYLNISKFYFKIAEDFPEIKEKIENLFLEKIANTKLKVKTIEEKFDILQIPSRSGSLKNEGLESFAVRVKENILNEYGVADILKNIIKINRLGVDLKNEILRKTIDNISNEEDYYHFFNGEDNFDYFFNELDDQTKINFIFKISTLNPWLVSGIFGDNEFEVVKKFNDENQEILRPIVEKSNRMIEIFEDNPDFISDKISNDDFPINKDVVESCIAGSMCAGIETTRLNNVSYDLISIPFSDFNNIFYSNVFQEELKRNVAISEITWMNAVSVVHAVFRKIKKEKVELNDQNIKKYSELIFEQREKVAEYELFGPNNYLILISGDDPRMLDDSPEIAKLFKECGGKSEDILYQTTNFRRFGKEKVLKAVRSVSEIENVKNGSKTVTFVIHAHGLENGLGYQINESDDFLTYEELAQALHDSGCIKFFNLIPDSCFGYNSIDNLESCLESEGTGEKPRVSITTANENLESFFKDFDLRKGNKKIKSYFFEKIKNQLDANFKAIGTRSPFKVKNIYQTEGSSAFLQDASIRIGDPAQYKDGWEKKEFFTPEQLKKFREKRNKEKDFYERTISLDEPAKFSLEIGKGLSNKKEREIRNTV